MRLHARFLDLRQPDSSILKELQLRFTGSRGNVDSVATLIDLLRSAFLGKRGRWHQITFRGIDESTLGSLAIGFVAEERGEDVFLCLEPELPKSNLMICLERFD